MTIMTAGKANHVILLLSVFSWLTSLPFDSYVANELQFDDCLWPRGESWYHNRRIREARASEGESCHTYSICVLANAANSYIFRLFAQPCQVARAVSRAATTMNRLKAANLKKTAPPILHSCIRFRPRLSRRHHQPLSQRSPACLLIPPTHSSLLTDPVQSRRLPWNPCLMS